MGGSANRYLKKEGARCDGKVATRRDGKAIRCDGKAATRCDGKATRCNGRATTSVMAGQ